MSLQRLASAILCLSVALGAAPQRSRTNAGIAITPPGIIEGHVRDRSGQLLPGVSVTTIPERGGLARHTTTDRGGGYRLEVSSDQTYRVDFDLLGFDLTRQNHVPARASVSTVVDAVLSVSRVCECISSGAATAPGLLTGQVVDEANRPLPHARLEMVSPSRRETAYADREGRFLVHAPVDGTRPITASDSGFVPVTRQISKASTGPIVFRLRYVGTNGLPNTEQFVRGCCPEYFAPEGH